MKIKQLPDDFQVEELSEVTPTAGPFALYRLEKRGWTTPDALNLIRRRWKLDFRRLSYGGLKDRHAFTHQFFTVFRGPQRNLNQQEIFVQYLGQVPNPFTSADIRANRFALVLRALLIEDVDYARRALEEVRQDGVPNYFDDQRFGSVSPGGDFVARAIVLGNYEQALRLALAAPYEFDRASQKKEKALLRSNWGNWSALKENLTRSHARSLVDYLGHHPDDFKGAIIRLRPELRGLYLAAYQSHLWNRMLARWLKETLRADQVLSVPLRLATVPMHRRLDDTQRQELAELQLPLPSPKAIFPPEDPRGRVMNEVLQEEGLHLEQLKLKGFKEMFFSRGERAALCLPTGLSAEDQPDEIHAGKRKLLLRFDLPRGSYATLVVKRITRPSVDGENKKKPPRSVNQNIKG